MELGTLRNPESTSLPTRRCSVVLSYDGSLHDPPSADPSLHPPRSVGVLSFKARQPHAGIRAVNKGVFSDVHPHVRHTATRLSREEEKVTGLQRFNDGRDE